MMLELNGIQHFTFCKRQWALMYLESVWEENADTMLGRYIHKRVDNPYFEEKRNNKVIVRAMPVISHRLGFVGICDVVEFRKSDCGISLKKYDGLWEMFVVEYKKGKPKKDNSDISQLIAQVMSLEEMFDTIIPQSAIYYKTENKRYPVEVTDDLREMVERTADEMHNLYSNNIIPKADSGAKCTYCSLKEKCMPRLTSRKKSVKNYILSHMEEL